MITFTLTRHCLTKSKWEITDGQGVVGTKSKGDQIAAHGTMGGDSTGQGVEGKAPGDDADAGLSASTQAMEATRRPRAVSAARCRRTGAHGEPFEAPLLACSSSSVAVAACCK
jgi:hypothetical protein